MAQLCQHGIKHIINQAVTDLERLLQPLQEHIDTLFSIHHKIAEQLGEDLIYPAGKVQQNLCHLAEMLLTKSGGLRKSLNKKQGIYPKSRLNADVEALQKSFKEHHSILQEALSDDVLTKLHEIRHLPIEQPLEDQKFLTDLSHVLNTLHRDLSALFIEHSICDFTQISQDAIQALKTDVSLQNFCRENIHHVLIDEFQDTSQTQYQLLDALTAIWPKASHRTLFAVGDPMQSIYRFRQADVKLFMQLQQQAINHIDPSPIALECNFRSSTKIIHQVNDLFEHIFPKKNAPFLAAIQYSQAHPTQPQADHHGISLYQETATEPSAQAQRCLEIIQALQRKHPGERIAILVQARSHLKHIIPTLENANIAFNAIDIYPTINLSAIQDLTALLSGLVDPYDQLSWHTILRSPLCGLSIASLASLPKNNDSLETILNAELSNPEQPYLQKLQSILKSTLQQIPEPVAQVWNIWQALQGPSIYPSDQKAAIDHWFQSAAKLSSEQQPLHRQAILDFFASSYTSQHKIGATVELLTAHKSKGLEYHHVIIPHLEKRKPPGKSPLFYCENGQHPIIQPTFTDNPRNIEYFKQLNKTRDQYESMRLFYVACTRAKSTLHLLGHWVDEPNPKSWLESVWQYAQHGSLPIHSQETQIEHQQTHQTLSYVRTQDHQLPNITPVLLPAENFDSKRGSALHFFIQHIDHPNRDLKWHYYVSCQGFSPAEVIIVKQQANQILKAQKDCAHFQWILDKHVWQHNEFNLCHESQHQIIDRVFFDQEHWYIIDYKFPNNPSSDMVSRYQSQLDGYRKALMAYPHNPYPEAPITTALYLPLEQKMIKIHHNLD